MRLKKIRLAGFKSFVDPTTLLFISNLSGVVGPNGCGKSNVIDAVRWVMGESSAKRLRGEEAVDVIFNGSTTRKAVGQATVELLFDNTAGLGGAFAKYAEISLKRQMTRDGQSHYFLNGQRCRRREITELFLGTGVGARSYAIIEQGMIARVLEAKPEELRVFIEEVAGISKYKERRRETLSSIEETRHNLCRLEDMREALESQWIALEKEAQKLAEYHKLQAEVSEVTKQCVALAWVRLEREKEHVESSLEALRDKRSLCDTKSQRCKAEQEKVRLETFEKTEIFQKTQKQYYALGETVTQTEQVLESHRRQCALLEQEQSSKQQSLEKLKTQCTEASTRLETLKQLKEEAQPLYEELFEKKERMSLSLKENESSLEEKREALEATREQLSLALRAAEIEKVALIHLEEQISALQAERAALEKTQSELEKEVSNLLGSLESALYVKEADYEALVKQVQEAQEAKKEAEEELEASLSQIRTLEGALQEKQRRVEVLRALKRSLLQHDSDRATWLQQHGFSDAPYWIERLEVTPLWQIAFEQVCCDFLQAVQVPEKAVSSLELLPLQKGEVTLIERNGQAFDAEEDPNRLLFYVKSIDSLPLLLRERLAQIWVCPTQEEAQAKRKQLEAGESVVTPKGFWAGREWIKIRGLSRVEGSNLLQNESERQTLEEALTQEEEHLALLLLVRDEQKAVCLEKASWYEKSREAQQEAYQALVKMQSEKRIQENQQAEKKKRLVALKEGKARCDEKLIRLQDSVRESRGKLQKALEDMVQWTQHKEALAQEVAQFQKELQHLREGSAGFSEEYHRLDLNLKTYHTQQEALQERFQDLLVQKEETEQRLSFLEKAIKTHQEPQAALEAQLEEHLKARLVLENVLTKHRNVLGEGEQALQALEKEWQRLEEEKATCQEKAEKYKLDRQTLLVHSETLLEQLAEEEEIETLVEMLPESASESLWKERRQTLSEKITQLGPLNLRAMESCEEVRNKKTHLDMQKADLTEALTLLEEAIQKIDQETQTRFKQTFDTLNELFSELFPRLFGGGRAYLQILGEESEAFEAGVRILASPPGKKNSALSQLSGGEKALTAIAFVFSLFKLNPSPFCMLDEVDAPLDDNNVLRFRELVKEMSETVQFIFVSHNKLAIEIAEQLQGVTMREPGVSRVVTVDIEEARRMIEA